jgi:hypothetical protein
MKSMFFGTIALTWIWAFGAQADLLAEPSQRTQFLMVAMDSTPLADKLEENAIYRFFHQVHPTGDATFSMMINTGHLQLEPGWKPRPGSKWAESPESWRPYVGTLPKGRGAIDYARNPDEILGRVANIQALEKLGVEFGSHTVRHDSGLKWTTEQWQFEFEDHQRVLNLLRLSKPVGFRAPFLDFNSAAGKLQKWPRRVNGVWEFTVPQITLMNGKSTLFFDLNLQNNHKVTDDEFVEMTLREFEKRYNGTRVPLMISGHAGYLDATARVMKQVCARPHVRCGSMNELARYMDTHPELEGAN